MCNAAGICTCAAGYSGQFCEFQACAGVTCSGQGTCNPNNGTCTCDEGFSGVDCSIGGGGCVTSADCGVWAPARTNECANGYTCVDNLYGGQCVGGACQCEAGFTCPSCTSKGYFECALGSGGGPCAAHTDCGAMASGATGGYCFDGRCICYAGYSCPNCLIAGGLAAGQTCPTPNPANARGGAPCVENQQCGPASGGTGGACVDGACACFGGFTCPSCNHLGDLGLNETCAQPARGGACVSDSECNSGLCTHDNAYQVRGREGIKAD